MSRQAKPYVTPEEYLARERRSEHKSEYFGGEIFAMTGASRKHNLVAGNLFAGLKRELRDRPCESYISDMRVRIAAANVYTYPDVAVVCGQPEFEDAEVDILLNPTLIVEVLSKSTAAYDRVAKFEYYRTLPSLLEYLLVSQDDYHVTQYVKQQDGRWLLADIRGAEGRVELRSVGCALTTAEIYDRVELP